MKFWNFSFLFNCKKKLEDRSNHISGDILKNYETNDFLHLGFNECSILHTSVFFVSTNDT